MLQEIPLPSLYLILETNQTGLLLVLPINQYPLSPFLTSNLLWIWSIHSLNLSFCRYVSCMAHKWSLSNLVHGYIYHIRKDLYQSPSSHLMDHLTLHPRNVWSCKGGLPRYLCTHSIICVLSQMMGWGYCLCLLHMDILLWIGFDYPFLFF